MSTTRDRCDVAAVLASLVEESRRIQGRVRLQKMVYLLSRLGLRQLWSLWFDFQHYGSHSEDLAGIVDQAARAGVLNETQDLGDEWQLYEYTPSSRAKAYADQVTGMDRVLVRRVVDTTRGLPWRVLELSATIDYLRRKYGLTRDAASHRAVELKPALATLVASAMGLLTDLGLG